MATMRVFDVVCPTCAFTARLTVAGTGGMLKPIWVCGNCTDDLTFLQVIGRGAITLMRMRTADN